MSAEAALFFVTGAPRSGTTFVSDWITESPEAYCVHEVLRQLAGRTSRERLAYLRQCAATGEDRTGKPLQREFLRWDRPRTKASPRVLGFKEPVVWPVEPEHIPQPVGPFLREVGARRILLVRHPLDVVASARHRALHTRNWPGFTCGQLCDFWRDALALHDSWSAEGVPLLTLRWEELLLRQESGASLGGFLGTSLPAFDGNEATPGYLRRLRAGVTLEGGAEGSAKRRLLTAAERREVRARTADLCDRLGYAI
ncbi:MAG TPA: hypothetical protein VKM72_20710 [Thermoanaerobaculia bacterium]|nr:hypothetical protein [Thermoanaerobaculia bacterium]